MFKVEWETLMNVIINSGYNTEVHFNEDEDDENYDDNCVYCPECNEPLYEVDFPEVPADDDGVYCPICETRFEY